MKTKQNKIIPEFPPKNEKFPASPILSLTIPNFGEVFIKDESVHRWSGTHKDRMAWEIIVSYKNLEQAMIDGRIHCDTLPQFSLISSGSACIAIGRMLREFGYPPLKVLSDVSLEKNKKLCSSILASNCELYLHNLSSKEISVGEILQITNNPSGFDLTDFQNTARSIFSYDWLCYEILNEKPDYIFTPYGSGTLFREIVNVIKNEVGVDTSHDKRLDSSISSEKLRFINVLGATSNNPNTLADKLFAPFRPYHQRNLHEIYYYKRFGYIGNKTGVYTILEQYLQEAYELVQSANIDCEYSGCAGLALFLQMREDIPKKAKVLIVNTGKLRL